MYSNRGRALFGVLSWLSLVAACGGIPPERIVANWGGSSGTGSGTPTSTGAAASGAGPTGGAAAAGAVMGGGAAGQAAAGGQGGSAGASMSAAGTSGSGGSVTTGCTTPPASPATIYLIGDSTMSVYASNLYPRMGWGQPLGNLFVSSCAVVVDQAISGRSSKSFFDEGAWAPVKAALKAGDYVLIQFGHNDQKSDDVARYTDPPTTYKQFLTTYVNDAREKQATPILLTPIHRNSWSGGKVSDTHGAYPPAVRELAAALQVGLIDLTALTKAYFERIGQAETNKLFLNLPPGASPNYPEGVTDNTHLQDAGAVAIGKLAMADAYSQNMPFAALLSAVPVPP
jgi:lysophospholipase L1-like esterase